MRSEGGTGLWHCGCLTLRVVVSVIRVMYCFFLAVVFPLLGSSVGIETVTLAMLFAVLQHEDTVTDF